MMKIKKISLTAALLICFFVNAQNYKVMYQIVWKPSLEKEELTTDLGVLIINDSKSYFSGYDNFKADSLKSKIVADFFSGSQKGSLRFPEPNRLSKFKKTILKNTVSDSIIQEEKFFVNTFHILSKWKPKWKLVNETKELFGYTSRKAYTNLGGRTWTAWYTENIPISEGPYKFYGLPGLILSIHDDKNEYSFEIKGITKENNDLTYKNFGLPNSIQISQKKWNLFYKKYKAQPSIIFENLNTETTTYVINGKEIGRDEKKDYDEKQKKYLLENNNELEDNCN